MLNALFQIVSNTEIMTLYPVTRPTVKKITRVQIWLTSSFIFPSPELMPKQSTEFWAVALPCCRTP